uniref:Protein SYM1 n=1 Tax=Blastobotrys adeninivorans TaxID=409370 RepID=A0A060SXX2_BLAAD
MSSFLRWYSAKLASNPLTVNVISTAALFGTGDAIAQALDKQDKPYDVARTSRACVYGGVIFAPIATQWYPLINRLVHPNPAIQSLKRVAADQLGFAPFVGIPLYFSCLGAMEGKSSSDIKESLQSKYKDTLFTNWLVWPAVQMANFWVVPVQHRLLVVNIVSVAWNAFLSAKNAQVVHAVEAFEHAEETLEAKVEGVFKKS